jgi:hypothetical protein
MRTLGWRSSKPFLQSTSYNGERNYAIELFVLSQDVDKVVVGQSFDPFLCFVKSELQDRYLMNMSPMCWRVESKVFLPNPLLQFDRQGGYYIIYCSLTESSYPALTSKDFDELQKTSIHILEYVKTSTRSICRG